MACCGGQTLTEAQALSNNLEISLRKERFDELFKFKVLLLGGGESGKSTVVKQIKLSHGKKSTPKELEQVADSLHQNVIDCMKTLYYACTSFDYAKDLDATLQETALKVQNFDEGKRIDYEFGEQITALWESEPIKKTYKRNDEFWLLDSCKYYFDRLEFFTDETFEPSSEDIVMARIRTTGTLYYIYIYIVYVLYIYNILFSHPLFDFVFELI